MLKGGWERAERRGRRESGQGQGEEDGGGEEKKKGKKRGKGRVLNKVDEWEECASLRLVVWIGV
jgi:hypothetical protein